MRKRKEKEAEEWLKPVTEFAKIENFNLENKTIYEFAKCKVSIKQLAI